MNFLHGLLRQTAGEGVVICSAVLATLQPAVGLPLLPASVLLGVWGIYTGVEIACWSEIAEFERRRRF